jgi:mannose-6-phosphate isomerase-like protein (cupin superfamily)
MSDYTIRNLREAEDQAAKFGFGEMQEARFPREDLGAEATGVGYIAVRPGRRQPFAHHHKEAEEVYVVLSGSGRLRLDDDIVEVGPLDAIRISPPVTRLFEAGPEGLELLVFGAHHPHDAQIVEGFWAD